MQPVKRIEIVADSVELGKLINALEESGASSYTIVHNVASKGIRGTAFDDSAVTMLDNVYVIAFCSLEKIEQVADTIRPVLSKFGGSCWISEVVEIRSMR